MVNISNEIKTGIMVLLCMSILSFLVIRTGDLNVNKEGYELKILFNTIGGIRENAPVRLCGMDVGQVTSVQLYYGDETQIMATLWLDSTAKIRKAHSFMRSATAPETMDMAVATNTTWKKKSDRLE